MIMLMNDDAKLLVVLQSAVVKVISNIQADKLSQTGILVQVMDQIRLAGVENISVAAAPGVSE